MGGEIDYLSTPVSHIREYGFAAVPGRLDCEPSLKVGLLYLIKHPGANGKRAAKED
jgi:hypothetical protein